MLENTNVQEINDAIEVGREEGIAEGMKKGMEKGMKKGASEERRNTLATLKKMGLSDEQIQLFIKAREEL